MASSTEINGILIDVLYNTLGKKISVPSNYHSQVSAVKTMQTNDCTGLVDSLSDFLVTSAMVNYSIETSSQALNKKLKNWLNREINAEYKGQIPRGIQPLAEEYFKERWKSSSFPILKIAKWEKKDGLKIPTKMFFVDGESVYAKDAEQSEGLKLGNYSYYIGMEKKDPLNKGVIITKPFARWFNKYPVPFMIKRGIYNNFKIVEALKEKQSEILNQVVPYMFLLKKGSEALTLASLKGNEDDGLIYTDTEIKDSLQQIKDTIADTFTSYRKEMLSRGSQWDEELKHLIPELKPMFEPLLFTAAEKAILGGFGFLDIAESVASNRKESILNPTAFIMEIERGVKDFKNHILRELIFRVIEENADAHKIYMKKEFEIVSSPIKGFMTDKFRTMIRSLYDRGIVSRQTAVEMGVEIPFEAEVTRIKREKERGLEEDQYPPITQNIEKDVPPNGNVPIKKVKDNDVPDDKKGIEKKNFNNATVDFEKDLEMAPYPKLSDIPASVKKYSLKIKREWRAKWNSSYYYKLGKTDNKKEAEKYAFKVANSILLKESK